MTLLYSDVKVRDLFILNGIYVCKKISENEFLNFKTLDKEFISIPNLSIFSSVDNVLQEDWKQQKRLMKMLLHLLMKFNIDTDENIRHAALFFQKIPSYFWHVPASTSGKNHGEKAQSQNGLVYHTKATLYIASELIITYDAIANAFEILLAALLHDSLKYGCVFDRKQFSNHPVLPAMHYGSLRGNPIPAERYDLIMRLINSHMGCIAKGGWSETGRKPEDCLEILIHTADYVASRNLITFNDSFKFKLKKDTE